MFITKVDKNINRKQFPKLMQDKEGDIFLVSKQRVLGAYQKISLKAPFGVVISNNTKELSDYSGSVTLSNYNQ